MLRPIVNYLLRNQFLFTVILLVVGFFIFQIRNILILFFIAYILMAALYPFVEVLKKKKIPNSIAVFIPFLIMIIFILLLVFSLLPFFVTQIQALFVRIPLYIDQVAHIFGKNFNIDRVSNFFDTVISGNVFAVTGQVFGGFFSFLTIFVMSFYLLVDHENINKNAASVFPRKYHDEVLSILHQIEEKLGAWLRGQFVLSFSIGFTNYIAYSLVGLEFALPLAVISGILEIVPTIGPILGAIPAVIVALNISTTMALVVIGIYFVIQMLESNILVPKIMEKAIGLNPLIVLLGIIIGGELMGIGGALLSIPFISLVVVVLHNLQKYEG